MWNGVQYRNIQTLIALQWCWWEPWITMPTTQIQPLYSLSEITSEPTCHLCLYVVVKMVHLLLGTIWPHNILHVSLPNEWIQINRLQCILTQNLTKQWATSQAACNNFQLSEALNSIHLWFISPWLWTVMAPYVFLGQSLSCLTA